MVGRPCIALLALSAAACADEPAPTPAPAPARPPTVTTGPRTLPTPPVENDVEIRLVSPGAEPRQPLRYRPRVGQEQMLVLESGMDMAMIANGNRMFGQKGTTTGSITVRVDKVEGERITVALTVLELSAPSYDPTDFSSPRILANQSGTFVMSDRGRVLDTNLPFLENSQLARDAFQLTEYLFQLPEEPVGRGARWEVRSVALRNGLAIRSVDHVELIELDSTTGRTKTTMDLESWPQLVNSWAQDPVTVFETLTFRSSGSGEGTFSLERPMPGESTTKFQFTSDMRIRRPDITQNITMTMDANLHTREANGGRPR